MRAETLNSYRCQIAGQPAEATVGKDALIVNGSPLSYVDMDEVVVDGWNVHLQMAGRDEVVVGQLGRGRDDFLKELQAARSRARRAALLQWTGDRPIDSYVARNGDQPQTVTLFPDGLTVEPPVGPPAMVPLGLVRDIRREGYAIEFSMRGGDAVTVRQLGHRTDEFLADVDKARAELAARTAEAYAAYDPALAGLAAPDGWAVSKAEAGRHWEALRSAVGGQSRGAEVEALERLAGDRLRLGIKASVSGESMPFALAPVGTRVAVEGTDTQSRATYVFEVGAGEEAVDRLNVVLLLISFRREAIYLPEAELGRWAVAVRVLEIVRWARGALAGRVVHDAQWEANLRGALSG